MEKPITIKDIAKKLGLSTSTVSRALSDSWEIKKETKELVIKTAELSSEHAGKRVGHKEKLYYRNRCA
jgi:LacI family transcriptional regulator